MTEAETEIEGAQLCEGVQLLLQRMESHPKEFEVNSGKWGNTMRVIYERVHNSAKPNNVMHEPWITQEEVYAIWHKYREIKQQEFHEFVMKTLFEGEAAPKEQTWLSGNGIYDIANLQPGGVLPVPLPNTSIVSRLKQELGIK